MTCFTVFYGTSHSLVVYRYFFVEQCVGTLGMTMFLTGGNTETILISCFSNMKIYTRYCAAAANDFIRLRGVVCFVWLVFLERARGEHVPARRPRNSSLQKLQGGSQWGGGFYGYRLIFFSYG